jgi:hypothetical protein
MKYKQTQMYTPKIPPLIPPSPSKSQPVAAGANTGCGKRRRPAETANIQSIWDIPKTTSLGWSPYLVITPAEKSDKLTSLSVFKIGDTLRACGVDKPKSVTKLKSGDLLVHVDSQSKSERLLKVKTFSNVTVTVQAHKTLNSSKGVVKSRELDTCTEEELVKGVEGVTHARRIYITRDGKKTATRSWVLTFDSPKPPTSLRVEYLELEVRPFVPNPMRCFNCQRFGHSKQFCRREAVCPQCGKAGHAEEKCTASPRCPNCQGTHSAFSKECPKWREEKAILTHRAHHGGTFAEARAAVFPKGTSAAQTYAKAVQQGPKPQKAVAQAINAKQSQPIPAKQSRVNSPLQSKPKTKSTPAALKKDLLPQKGVETSNKFDVLSAPSQEEEEDMDTLLSLPSSSSSSLPPTPSPLPSLHSPLSSPLPLSPNKPDRAPGSPDKAVARRCPSASPRRSTARKNSTGGPERSASRTARPVKHGGLKDGAQPSFKKTTS